MSIIIYSKPACAQCDQAKMLLKMKGIEFTTKVLDVDYTSEELKELVPTARTFPVIFNEDEFIGGYNELRIFLNR